MKYANTVDSLLTGLNGTGVSRLSEIPVKAENKKMHNLLIKMHYNKCTNLLHKFYIPLGGKFIEKNIDFFSAGD